MARCWTPAATREKTSADAAIDVFDPDPPAADFPARLCQRPAHPAHSRPRTSGGREHELGRPRRGGGVERSAPDARFPWAWGWASVIASQRLTCQRGPTPTHSGRCPTRRRYRRHGGMASAGSGWPRRAGRSARDRPRSHIPGGDRVRRRRVCTDRRTARLLDSAGCGRAGPPRLAADRRAGRHRHRRRLAIRTLWRGKKTSTTVRKGLMCQTANLGGRCHQRRSAQRKGGAAVRRRLQSVTSQHGPVPFAGGGVDSGRLRAPRPVLSHRLRQRVEPHQLVGLRCPAPTSAADRPNPSERPLVGLSRKPLEDARPGPVPPARSGAGTPGRGLVAQPASADVPRPAWMDRGSRCELTIVP